MRSASDTSARQWLRAIGEHPPVLPSAVVVLAHPDDETVGAASLLPALSLGYFVYVTDGSPRDLRDARAADCATREEYAAMRRGELLSALTSVGIDPERVEGAGIADQDASRHLAALARFIAVVLREHAPDIVLTHAYEGGHPDHDATAFAVHLACRRMAASGATAPIIVEFTSYHAAGERWAFGEFLPSGDEPPETVTRTLAATERSLKRRLIGCYASQRGVLQQVPLEVEQFRIAPEYDFVRAPHQGRLLYERYAWGMTGAEWRERARAAEADIMAATAGSESVHEHSQTPPAAPQPEECWERIA